MNKIYLSGNYIIVEKDSKLIAYPKNHSEYDENIDNFILRKYPNINIVEFKFSEIGTWFAFDGSTAYTVESLRIFLRQNTGFSTPSGGSGGSGVEAVETYNDLQPGLIDNQLVFVRKPIGTPWLPGSLGGTYRPDGWYVWDSNTSTWEAIDDEEANQLALNTAALDQKADINHTHTKSQITDFNDNDYATSSQGDKADTAIQPGDLAFVAISGDYDDLINKPIKDLALYRSSLESDGFIYSGFILDGNTITIKKVKEGIESFAQNLTNLETDWVNRLTLNYI